MDAGRVLTKLLFRYSGRYCGNDPFSLASAMDNVIDRTIYPLKEQEDEAVDKRRMGLGITGLANTGEMMGLDYGSEKFLKWAEKVFACLRDLSLIHI